MQYGFPQTLPDKVSDMVFGNMVVAYHKEIADQEDFELHGFAIHDQTELKKETVYENTSALQVSTLIIHGIHYSISLFRH